MLITVKTYPLSSTSNEELVCTAGVLEDGRWIRIYPIPFPITSQKKKFEKYEWIQVDLVRNTSDFRPESYKPKSDASQYRSWLNRNRTWMGWEKKYILQEVFTSFDHLISLAKGEAKIISYISTLRDCRFYHRRRYTHVERTMDCNYEQYDLFEIDKKGEGILRKIVDKLPYKYPIDFMRCETQPRTLMIEVGNWCALLNCLKQVVEMKQKQQACA